MAKLYNLETNRRYHRMKDQMLYKRTKNGVVKLYKQGEKNNFFCRPPGGQNRKLKFLNFLLGTRH